MKSHQYYSFIKGRYLRTLRSFDRHFDWKITGRWMLYSVIIGVAGAFGAFVLTSLVHGLTDLLLTQLTGFDQPVPGLEGTGATAFDLNAALIPARRWLFLIIPALGG